MGSRGRLAKVGSRRWERAQATNPPAPPERPIPPGYMPDQLRALFEQLVNDGLAANVPFRLCDAHALASAASAIHTLMEAKAAGKTDPAKLMRFSREATAALESLGLTPRSRARLNVPIEKAPELDPIDEVMFA